ncbi:hypothetical protein [Bacillus safensis]
MPGSENLLFKYVYSTPENIYCRTPFGRVWCGLKWVEHTIGVFAGFTYPSISAEDQTKIYNCAAAGGIAATPPITAAVAGCGVTAGTACFAAVAAAIPVANELLRSTFLYCLKEHTDLSDDIISQCEIGIYQKELGYTQGQPSQYSLGSHCKICCKGFTGEYICQPLPKGAQPLGKWVISPGYTIKKSFPNISPTDPRCVICCKGFTGEDVCFPIG